MTYTAFVNGRPKSLAYDTVSYETAVGLAEVPTGYSAPDFYTVVVCYPPSCEHRSRTISQHESAPVSNGMSITVADTSRA